MTTANKITILRVLLVPFFVVQALYYVERGVEGYRLAAILTFGIAAISDGLDGYMARRYNQRSQLGAILDPLADKLLLVSGVLLLSFDNRPWLPQTPLWLVGTIVGRDVLLLIGLVVIYYSCGSVTVRPIFIGKLATVLQMTCVLWGLFKWDATWLQFWSAGAALCTGVSGMAYVYDGIRQLSASPSSGPTAQPSAAPSEREPRKL
ncbi:MAG: CDP-alcohol phosphatidyltransferase family protein [Verrucomicrobiota bacterium]